MIGPMTTENIDEGQDISSQSFDFLIAFTAERGFFRWYFKRF